MDEGKKQQAFRWGLIIMGILAVLTIIEFVFGAFFYGFWILLMAIAVVKAFFVIRDYMHLPRLFAGDEEAHE